MAFSSFVLRHLTSEAERIGTACPHLLTGIFELSKLRRESFWVPDRDMYEIVARAVRASKTTGLGLQLGERGSFAAIGASGLLLSVAESFRQALRALVHFQRVACDIDDSLLLEEGPRLTLRLATLKGPSQFTECMTEFIASNLTALLGRFAGSAARLTRALFDYPAPAHVAAYEAVFACELQFNEPHCALVVDAALADRVQRLSQPALAQQLWKLGEQDLLRFRQVRTIVDEVRDVLRVNCGAQPPRIASLARRLGMSERSLRRRLAEMKVDYRSLVVERQREVATQMLRRQEVSVKEVAHGLGYRNASSFNRAFKRWTGASPQRHRRDDR